MSFPYATPFPPFPFRVGDIVRSRYNAEAIWRIVSLDMDSKGKGYVRWEHAYNGREDMAEPGWFLDRASVTTLGNIETPEGAALWFALRTERGGKE